MHWYTLGGIPAYTQPNKSKPGETRPTTLADARKLDLRPSVTTVMSVGDKDGLVRWKMDKLLDTVYTTTITELEIYSDNEIPRWKAEMMRLAEREMGKAAKRGNEIHDALENRYKFGSGAVEAEAEAEIVDPVIKAIENKLGEVNWIAEESFCGKYYGGKVDLHSKDSNGIVLDFKTKATDDPKKMIAYDEHAMQLAAYRIGLGIPSADCYNVFISTEEPGLLKIKHWSEKEMQRAERMFKLLVKFWYLKNKFDIVDDLV